jgi:hypothetical protein
MAVCVWIDVMGVHTSICGAPVNVLVVIVPEILWPAYAYKVLPGRMVTWGRRVPRFPLETDAAFVSGVVPSGVSWGMLVPSGDELTPDEVAFAASYGMLSARAVDERLGSGASESIAQWRYWPNPDHPRR